MKKKKFFQWVKFESAEVRPVKHLNMFKQEAKADKQKQGKEGRRISTVNSSLATLSNYTLIFWM